MLLTSLMTILVQLQEKLKPLLNFQIYKSFQDFPYHPDEELLFTTPTDASLNSDKSTSKCLPVKILKLLKNDVSTHLIVFIGSIPIHIKNRQSTQIKAVSFKL